jgi:orotidine-5'-phosphate decarboxylase
MNDEQQAKLRQHVICALDVPGMDEALALVDRLGEHLSKFKVGSRLFTRCGPALLAELARRDVEVFLDLKFHDIPNTVADAVESALAFDAVFMLTIHAAGGAEMIRRAVRAADEHSASAEDRAKIVAVTALTSLAPADLGQLGVDLPLDDWAVKLGELALDAGADGLVCSANEASQMRTRFGADALLVTPGIRPESKSESKSTADDDQARIMRPKQALDAGSDFLVIGRPIYQADDPLRAVREIGRSV